MPPCMSAAAWQALTEARVGASSAVICPLPGVAPTRRGFGSMLLEKAAAQDFGAHPKIVFAPDGLNYEIDAPLSVMIASHVENPTSGCLPLERARPG